MKTHATAPKRSQDGFSVGDRVLTPMGRIARITALRDDEYLEGKYEDAHPTLAEVILQPKLLLKL